MKQDNEVKQLTLKYTLGEVYKNAVQNSIDGVTISVELRDLGFLIVCEMFEDREDTRTYVYVNYEYAEHMGNKAIIDGIRAAIYKLDHHIAYIEPSI